MRVHIDGTAEELSDPGVIAKLAKALESHAPLVAGALAGAGEDPEPDADMQFAALRDVYSTVTKRYSQTIDDLLRDVHEAIVEQEKAGES